MNWTPEKDAILLRMAAENKSGTEMAMRLGLRNQKQARARLCVLRRKANHTKDDREARLKLPSYGSSHG